MRCKTENVWQLGHARFNERVVRGKVGGGGDGGGARGRRVVPSSLWGS